LLGTQPVLTELLTVEEELDLEATDLHLLTRGQITPTWIRQEDCFGQSRKSTATSFLGLTYLSWPET
jgi:hypothetical protein